MSSPLDIASSGGKPHLILSLFFFKLFFKALGCIQIDISRRKDKHTKCWYLQPEKSNKIIPVAVIFHTYLATMLILENPIRGYLWKGRLQNWRVKREFILPVVNCKRSNNFRRHLEGKINPNQSHRVISCKRLLVLHLIITCLTLVG